MAALTLKQLVKNDMNQDKELTFPITGKTMSIDLTKIKSKFIKSFMCLNPFGVREVSKL